MGRLRSVLQRAAIVDPSYPRGPIAPRHAAAAPQPQLGTWDPVGQLSAVLWHDLYDLEQLPVTRAEAMSLPAVARARHTICTTIARISLTAQRDGEQLPPADAPLWLDRTDVAVSAWHRMAATVDDHLFYGDSLWLVERGADTFPIHAEHVPYALWDVDPDTGRIRVQQSDVPQRDVIYLPGPHEGILSYGARSIRIGTGVEKSAAEASAQPFRVELHNTSDLDLTEQEIDALIGRARAALSKNGGVLYTSRGVEARVHPAAAEHLLIAGRNATALDAARIVGIPADAVDADSGSSGTYANVNMRLRQLVEFGLAGYMAPISARLSLDDMTPHGTRITFDTEAALSASARALDPASREDPAE